MSSSAAPAEQAASDTSSTEVGGAPASTSQAAPSEAAIPSDSLFDEEMSAGWCFGATWQCTPAEAAGLWSTLLFYSTVVIGTVYHGCVQAHVTTAAANEVATHRSLHTTTDAGDEWQLLCFLLTYFFSSLALSHLLSFCALPATRRK